MNVNRRLQGQHKSGIPAGASSAMAPVVGVERMFRCLCFQESLTGPGKLLVRAALQ